MIVEEFKDWRNSMIRKMDDLGRLVVPKEWRDSLNILNGDEVFMEFDYKNKQIIIKPLHNQCAFCGVEVGRLFKIVNGVVCETCLDNIVRIKNNER